MFKFIKMGKLLEQGVMQYQQKDFTKASHVFKQALAINEQDFTANFWMARTLTMLGDYEGVKALLNKCRELGPQVIELLIVPLENLIQGLENGDRLSSELIVQYNSAADNSLHQCYFKKYYASALRQLL